MQPFLELSLIEFVKLGWRSRQHPHSYIQTSKFFIDNYHGYQFYTLNPCYEENRDDKFKKAAHLSQANSFKQHYNPQILFY